ncbi:chromate efflux transporter [Lutimaribacter marinistellae]|uniref:Chromate efflux transporter n=1 Tax=Lutimaribacter marinistellae TaxID=1820329 RepID=A0ABV7TL58_9RHOB
MKVTSRDLIEVFGRIGLLSFGGPAAQIALMHRELVERRNWLDEQIFLRALSLCMMLPGPEAMQLATYAGWRLRGVPGGLIAGTLFILPGAVVIAGLFAVYVTLGIQPLVQAAFLGIKAAVIVIVLQALRNLARKALTSKTAWVMAGMSFTAIYVLDLPFPLIIATAALWGFARTPTVEEPSDQVSQVAATPFRTVVTWLPLWLGPLAALKLLGPDILAETGWFFAKLAVVTFGGAYAVLAYMTQTVVQDYGWITTAQMIDALGLAETTPGPLILVTQFVAMLAGYGTGGLPLAFAAGCVALWATFVPCFLWIFLSAPYLERISANARLEAALKGITAAVVGVILNLSIWFALHVLFGNLVEATLGPVKLSVPDISQLDLKALILTLAAVILLIWFKRSLGFTLFLLALAGMALYLV